MGGIEIIFQCMFNSFVVEVVSNCDLICRGIYIGKIGGCWQVESYDLNVMFVVVSSVENCSL